jgi:hypothetical protein
MKPNFKKWMKDKGIPIEDYLSFYANQFAEEYAKQEKESIVKYLSWTTGNEWTEAEQLKIVDNHQKFKDES